MKLPRLWHRLTHRPKPWVSPHVPARPEELTGPQLAVVVICYKMDQQIGRTLTSMLPPYQRELAFEEFEIHLVDNGSRQPLDARIWNLSPNVKYHYISPAAAPVNPGVAINRAVRNTNSPLLCVHIDGARMLTPGVMRWGIDLANCGSKSIVDVRSWHLGHKSQNDSLIEGYSPEVERELLSSIRWPEEGYRLFDIGFPSHPTRSPFLKCVFESNCLFIPRSLFDQIGGFDERYSHPGGGLAGVDFFHRAVAASHQVFTLLGEGTFHQTHGGAASGLDRKSLDDRLAIWRDEYEALSRPWSDRHKYSTILAGHVPIPARRWLTRSGS
jgi:hypothetical protein